MTVNYKRKLNFTNRILEELYQDTVNQVIRVEDFDRLYISFSNSICASL